MKIRIPRPGRRRRAASAAKRAADDVASKGAKRHVARKAVDCVAAFAVLCVIPWFVNMAIGYLPVMAFVVVLALSFAYPRLIVRKLDFGIIVDRHSCLRDTDVKLLARFANGTHLLCPRVDVVFRVTDIFGEDDTVSRFSFSLGAHRTRDFEFGVRFAHIGTVSAGIREVVVYDPFGLFSRTVKASREEEIEVLPHVYTVDESFSRSLLLHEAMDSMTPFKKDGMDYTGVREYEYGDPLKSIHWKLSSHADGLYTRLFDAVGEPSITILCGTSFGDRDNESVMSLYDAELETALSIYDFGVENGLQTRIAFRVADGEAARFGSFERDGHQDVVAAFPLPVRGAADEMLPDLVLRCAAGPRGGSNVVVCAAELSDSLIDAVSSVERGATRIVLFYFLPREAGSRERSELMRPLRRLEQNNVSCYALETAGEIEGIVYG